jgi:hypothetical protein
MDQINGVESSYLSESGTLIRLSLRPGTDPETVTRAVRRVMTEQVEDRVPVPLGRPAAAAAFQQQEWRGKSQVAEFAAAEMGTSTRGVPPVVVALLLGCTALGLGLLWWRHRRKKTGEPSQ